MKRRRTKNRWRTGKERMRGKKKSKVRHGEGKQRKGKNKKKEHECTGKNSGEVWGREEW